MTKEDVLKLACEADVWVAGMSPYQEQLEEFAELVEAKIKDKVVTLIENYAMQYSEPVWAFDLLNTIRDIK